MNKRAWLTDKDYNFIYSRVPRLCIDLLIKKGKSVLLTKRVIEPGKNTWHLPGGRVLFGERLEKAAKRIAGKELGMKISLVKLLGWIEFTKERQSGKRRHSVSAVFLAKSLSEIQKTDFQSRNAVYYKILPKNIYFGHKKFLKEMF